MLVLHILATIVVGAACYWWSSGAVRTWRGAGRFSEHPMFRVQPQKKKDDIDRCVVPVSAIMFCVFAVLFESMFFSVTSSGIAHVVTAATAITALCLVGSVLLALSVLWFSFPKYAIAPQLRRRG